MWLIICINAENEKLLSQCLNIVFTDSMWLNILSYFPPLISSSFSLHPLALVPPSLWHSAFLTGSEPVESRLGLTRCLCLSHRELWNTETHWLHLTLGIRLPCSAWYNRAIRSAFCTSMLTFMGALRTTKKRTGDCSDAVNNCKDGYLETY